MVISLDQAGEFVIATGNRELRSQCRTVAAGASLINELLEGPERLTDQTAEGQQRDHGQTKSHGGGHEQVLPEGIRGSLHDADRGEFYFKRSDIEAVPCTVVVDKLLDIG